MPKRRTAKVENIEPTKLVVPRNKAESQLKERIQKGNQILNRSILTEDDLKNARGDYYKWSEYNSELLNRSFDQDTFAQEYRGINASSISDPPLGIKVRNFRGDVQGEINTLESILERLELIPEPDNMDSLNEVAGQKSLGSDIFIVHGSDDGTRETIARFIEKLDLNPVILREQPNAGRTIIEKFEDYANVGFAVVLMTPDDVGARASKQDNLQPRARQNVIFELGFFIGKLGRERVCALHKPNVEIMTDYSGVVYLPMDDADSWKIDLVKKINFAGIKVDVNKLIL
jgi:predicted nucleotide-binding protein